MIDPPGSDTVQHAEIEPLDDPELPVFDEQPLLLLREMVSFDNFMCLIENWFASLATRIERLVGAAASGDLGALKETAHDMSGTCGCFGALRLGELAWELEQRCRAGDLERARTLVRAMVPVTAATRGALRRRYFCH
jgi:HPt (histidine-containing phosphotransfer) domain-containing protein